MSSTSVELSGALMSTAPQVRVCSELRINSKSVQKQYYHNAVMLFIHWSLFQKDSVNLVRVAGDTPSPAAMRLMTLGLLNGRPGMKLKKTAKERFQIWLL